METMGPAKPKMPNPRLKAWGMGPMTSIASGETKARIALVPRMYSRAMTGAVKRMDRARFRPGLRDSPAKTATYSKPDKAPKVILLKTLRLKRVRGGRTMGRGL